MEIEGLREVRSALRQVGGKELEAELGQVHKSVGELVIRAVGGPDTGVGTGAGARIRPSASKREVLLRVGGGHRSKKVQQWGKRPVRPHPARPFILGAAESIQGRIEDEYLGGIDRVIRKAGLI